MKKALLLLMAAGISAAASAQIAITGSNLTYTQNFDGLDTGSASSSNLPAGFSIFEYGTSASVNQQYKGNNGASNSGDTYSYGTSGSNDRALGAIASGSLISHFGAKFVNNTGTTINGFTISYRGEQWRFGGPTAPATSRPNADSLRFLYSTAASSVSDTTSGSYTESTALMFNSPNYSGSTAVALDGNATGNYTLKSAIIPVTIAPGGMLVIKWVDKNIQGSDDGLAVDDLSITFSTTGVPVPSYRPIITALSPADNATNVAAGINLQITFDRAVSKGSTGNVMVKNVTDQTVATIPATSPDITVSGMVATITNVNIALGKNYYVTFDSSVFDTAGYKSYGIYDTTSWNFTTQGGLVTLISLNETFDAACAAGTLPAGWSRQNVQGPGQTWSCYTATGSTNAAMQINGFANSVNNVNEDWLITPKVNLNGSTSGKLIFKMQKSFTGPEMDVLTSTNYDGTSAPSSATWTPLSIPMSVADTGGYKTFTKLLGSAGNTPFYVAFKYVSTASDGYRIRLDSVVVNGGLGFSTISSLANTIPVTVIGAATNGHVQIAFDAANSGAMRVAIYDLTGRSVYSQQLDAVKGANRAILVPQNLQSGLYIIRIGNGSGQGIARTFIQ